MSTHTSHLKRHVRHTSLRTTASGSGGRDTPYWREPMAVTRRRRVLRDLEVAGTPAEIMAPARSNERAGRPLPVRMCALISVHSSSGAPAIVRRGLPSVPN